MEGGYILHKVIFTTRKRLANPSPSDIDIKFVNKESSKEGAKIKTMRDFGPPAPRTSVERAMEVEAILSGITGIAGAKTKMVSNYLGRGWP